MKKFMLDSNTIDRLLELEFSTLSELPAKIVLTANQVEEIARIPDKKMDKRRQLFTYLLTLKPELVPASVAILSDEQSRQVPSRVGLCCLGKGEVYSKIINESHSNSSDAVIADTAVSNDCILITDDKRFIAKMIQNGYDAISFDNFKSELAAQE